MAWLTWTLFFSVFLVFGTSKKSSNYVGLTLDKKNPIDPGQCGASNHGEIKLVQDRLGADRVLMCTKENPTFLWKTIDGSSTVGEYFDPAIDCSDVVDKVPDAADGFYWISSKAIQNVSKAWCDVTTDGGGFVLVAKKDDPVTWTVPSSKETVDPHGKPHWSSTFGKVEMLDIRFQISTTSNFKDTKAHWSFRLANKRPLGQLLLRNSGGCTKDNPGIGDIAFVKDLQTGKVVNKNFRCSIFSGHLSRLIGWGQMNKCLQQPCSPGFAYFYGVRLDDSGSFSYSAHGNSKSSGILHNSTAFIGCSHQKCCACYGPKGGTKNYCLPDCTSINGGIVKKKVHTWIWIRSSIPKRAWRKCIEYTVTDKNGKKETHSVEEETGIRIKGSCAYSHEVRKNGALLKPRFAFPEWELSDAFRPLEVVTRTSTKWVTHIGTSVNGTQGMAAGNTHILPDFVRDVALGNQLADVTMLSFRDPNSFFAGNLHNHLDFWRSLAALSPYDQATTVLNWIENRVNVFDFFQHFKGHYKGMFFDSDIPPPMIFKNAISCKMHTRFIHDTILDRLATGAISIWGRVNEVNPPHLVMPLTVEASKPRLCNDDRFLNLWIKDTPFKLDRLVDLPRYVSPNSFQTVCDDKSGYDHIALSHDSRTFFGFEWAGWYFVSNTIPFGWKSSAYIYQTTGLLASHYFRSVSIPCSLYIDDRHSGQLRNSLNSPTYECIVPQRRRDLASASAAIFLVCHTLIALGYFIGLNKSILIPTQAVPYLGFLVDSIRQAFALLPNKRKIFCDLLNSILLNSHTDLKTLQRLAGKCLSFSLAIPGARLFTNDINIAIGKASRNSRPIPLSQHLQAELEWWSFIETWQGCLSWRKEAHENIVVLCSDASNFAWGGVLTSEHRRLDIHDYWPVEQSALGINSKEVLALSNVLESFFPAIQHCWVDVFTDSQVLINAWTRQVARSPDLISSLKRLFLVVSNHNINLHLHYISSCDNPADRPSRTLSLQDAKLSASSWKTVQQRFGGDLGHTVDLMALQSNAQSSLSGSQLPFFSPYPVLGAAGVNVFAQHPSRNSQLFVNPYAFPPIALIPQLLRFLSEIVVSCTIVIPDVRPRAFWWPLLPHSQAFLLAKKGEKGVVLPPTSKGFSDTWSLPWDLWVFRFDPIV